MTGPAHRRARTRAMAEALGLGRLGVFVPALMSVGLAFWILSELNDMVRSRHQKVRTRQAHLAATAVADEALGRHTSGALGLRPRGVYLMIGLTALVAAGYVLIGSVANYVRDQSYVEEEAWLLAIASVATLLGLVIGVVALVVAATWPDPPMWARGVVMRTPLGDLTAPEDRTARASWRVTAFVGWSIAAVATVSAIVAWSPETTERINENVYGWLEPRMLLQGVAFLVPTGQFWFALVSTVAVVVLARRCRVVVVAYVASVLGGSLVAATLGPLVGRSRQFRVSPFGQVEAYPSTTTMLIVIFAGLVPLAAAVLFERPWLVRPLRVALGMLAALAALHQIADGALTTDVVGGAVIGLATVALTQWTMEARGAHRDCGGCPWSPSPYHGPFLGAIPIHPSAHDVLQVVARVAAAAGTIALAVVTLRIDLPPETSGYGLGSSVKQWVQYGLTAVMSVGVLVAWRWEGAGALLIAVAAAGAGIFAALEYAPGVAMVLTGALMVPAVLIWLSWQHRRHPREIVGLAVLTVVLIGGAWAGATTLNEHFFGPTHAESTAPDLPVDRVEWVWAGALTDSGLTVTAQLVPDAVAARLEVRPTQGGPQVLSDVVRPDEDRLVRLRVDGLTPGTDHRYRLLVDGSLDQGRGFGTFTTPEAGAFSFTVTASACARSGSNVAVFDAIREVDPLFHLALGDLHYGNIDSTDPSTFIEAYATALSTPAQSALARQAPMAYVWDDHDYGPNDADASFVGRAASREAYRRAVPHYPVTDGDTPINQAFTMGRVRFVLTDQRSEQTPDTMLGDAQRAWLLDELRTSSRTHALVVWVSTVPWIGTATPGSDNWSGHAVERTEIADVLATEGIDNLVMVSGDAHMVAVDDGTNSDYSTVGGAGFPVFHAAALDRPGSVKGGPYSHGAFPGFGQFGVLEFLDDGGPAITVEYQGRTWTGEVLVTYRETFAVPPGATAR